MSPAVVVPSMLLLQKEGYGVEQGIPTLLMAAGSFDDVLAITGFTTCLGVAFATGNMKMKSAAFSVLALEHTTKHSVSFTKVMVSDWKRLTFCLYLLTSTVCV